MPTSDDNDLYEQSGLHAAFPGEQEAKEALRNDAIIKGRKERAEMISEVMAHPAIAAHVALYDRILAAAERQAAAFEKIADALSRIAPTPERLQEKAEEAPLRRAEQEGRASFWKGIAHIIPVMAQQGAEMLARAQGDVLDTPGGTDEGSVQ